MSGWIKIHRSISNHWLYNEKRTYSKLEAWYDLLLNVNYSDTKTIIKGKLYEVKRGQSIMSLDSWAKRWNWDKSKVRRFFNMLQKDEMIELITDNITTQLTICKYESYQGEGNADETRTKRKRNADEIQTTPIEERKENKKETIPTFDEFLAYAISLKSNINTDDVRLKYNSWIENDWSVNRNGKLQPILRWKVTLSNTMPYLREVEIEEPKELLLARKLGLC
jgi:hypothetical protein